MKFICDKILLSNAIDGVSKAVTNRSAIPVLEGILLKAEGFQLTLTGYDMEIGITTTIESNVLVPGETVLNAKQLGDIIHRMPAGEVELELSNNGTVTIKGGVAEFEIPAMMAGDYPACPTRALTTPPPCPAQNWPICSIKLCMLSVRTKKNLPTPANFLSSSPAS